MPSSLDVSFGFSIRVSQRNPQTNLLAAHDNRGSKTTHIGVLEKQPMCHFLKLLDIFGRANEAEVSLSRYIIALLNLRLIYGAANKYIDLIRALSLKLDHYHEAHQLAHFNGVDHRDVAKDDA